MKPYYEQDNITIYHGDCREVLPLLGGPKGRVVLTDPPYGVHLGSKANNQQFDRDQYASYDDTPGNLETLIADAWPLMRAVACRTVLTPGVANMWKWPKPDHVGAFYYPAASGCNPWGFSCWQPIFYYGKDPYGGSGSRPDSFESTESAVPNGHPCPKPVGQWSKLFNRVVRTGDVVVDPFLGSGTTLVIAKTYGNRAIGIEREQCYCDIAIRRLAQGVLFGVEGAA